MIRFGFAFPGGVLSGGTKYTFTFDFHARSGRTVSSSVVITTSAPPAPGALNIDPTFGLSVYIFAASWTDIDLPLSHELSFSNIPTGTSSNFSKPIER